MQSVRSLRRLQLSLVVASIFAVLGLFSVPARAQDDDSVGGFSVDKGSRRLEFRLPTGVTIEGGEGTHYRDTKGRFKLAVVSLEPHPGLEALKFLKTQVKDGEFAPYSAQNANELTEAYRHLERWADLARGTLKYELDGGRRPGPLSKEAAVELQHICDRLLKLRSGASATPTELASGAHSVPAQVQDLCGGKADQRLVQLALSHRGRYLIGFGHLTARSDTWGDKSVIVVNNRLAKQFEQIVFCRVDNRDYAFCFSQPGTTPQNLDRLILGLVVSAHHVTEEELSKVRKHVSKRWKRDPELQRWLLLSELVALLCLLTTAGTATHQSYMICQSRVRLSIRQSLRIFRSVWTAALILGFFYLGLVYFELPIPYSFLTRGDLKTSLLLPGILLTLPIPTLSLIGARLGFHRSARLARWGAVLGVLGGAVLAYLGLKFILA